MRENLIADVVGVFLKFFEELSSKDLKLTLQMLQPDAIPNLPFSTGHEFFSQNVVPRSCL